MKTFNISLLFLVFFLIFGSCGENKKIDYNKLIIGKWSRTIDYNNEPPISGYDEVTFTFLENDSAIYGPGLYKMTVRGAELSEYMYIGNKVKYELLNDTLILYFPSSEMNTNTILVHKHKIILINKDSLFLKTSDNRLFKYHKVK